VRADLAVRAAASPLRGVILQRFHQTISEGGRVVDLMNVREQVDLDYARAR
jgi:hypothetical protein